MTFSYVPREDVSGATATIYGADIGSHDHTFGEWTVTKPATVTEEGEETRECTVCGEKETRPVAKLEPTYTIGDVDGNGELEAADARLALRASVGLEKDIVAGTAAYQAADYNQDGEVKSEDARAILRVSVKLDPFG